MNKIPDEEGIEFREGSDVGWKGSAVGREGSDEKSTTCLSPSHGAEKDEYTSLCYRKGFFLSPVQETENDCTVMLSMF